MFTLSRLHRVACLVSVMCFLVSSTSISARTSSSISTPPTIETVQRRAFDFFWHETHPTTGLTKDREKNAAGPNAGKATVASIASTGYMLASLPIAVEHGWVSRSAAYGRARTALRFIFHKMPQVHGFYYHFVDWRSGQRVWNSELSSIDTSLLVLGSLTAGQYWRGTSVQNLAEKIAGRLNWKWMQTDGGAKPNEAAPSMGWSPEKGFITARWQGYNESAYLYLLALGTPGRNNLPATSWNQWTFPTVWQEGYAVFGGPTPIFFAQMTAGYFDLRGLRDRQGRDWWLVWRNAHLADQAYCARHRQNKTYAAGFWGINASDQPDGYGAEWPEDGHNRGTVSPTAMLAAQVFTPNRSRRALSDLWTLRSKIWGRYGFSNAFNIDRNWYGPDVIGIDLGMMLLLTENARSGLIWRLMRSRPVAQRGLSAAGFHAVAAPDAVPKASQSTLRPISQKAFVAPNVSRN